MNHPKLQHHDRNLGQASRLGHKRKGNLQLKYSRCKCGNRKKASCETCKECAQSIRSNHEN